MVFGEQARRDAGLGEERDAAQVEIVGGVGRGFADGFGDGEMAGALVKLGFEVLFNVELGFAYDARHHGHGFHGIFAHGRLAGEHDGVGAVVDGVGHVGDLGARGPGILDHGFEHLRGRDNGLGIFGGAADDVLLNGGDLFRRHFHAQVAAGHHDAVGDLQDGFEMLDRLRLFQLGDDPGVAAERGYAVAHQGHVFGRAHKGDGDGVDAVIERELEVFCVFLRQRGRAHQDAGKIDALVFAQQAAVDNIAGHVLAVHFVDAQLDESVGEQNARALLHVFGEGLEGGAHQRCRARHVARCDDEPVAGLEQHGQMIFE